MSLSTDLFDLADRPAVMQLAAQKAGRGAPEEIAYILRAVAETLDEYDAG